MKKKSGIAPAPRRKAKSRPRARVILVTGMSGAGRSTALKALEDAGFEAVDNLPLTLLANLVGPGSGIERPLAVGVDVRTRGFDLTHLTRAVESLRARRNAEVKSVFLD